MKAFPGIVANAAEGVEAWASLDLERAMSKVNAAPKPDVQAK
jgi:hypothetical protein